MIDRIGYIESKTANPYYNLALEEYLFFHCEKTECILYIWQDNNAVVIGKDRNESKDCNFDRMEEGQCILVRRMSEGRAIYHDMGNLNFTFFTRRQNCDIDRQLNIVIRALRELGITAVITGQNELSVEGRKISECILYEEGDRCYHHGTIMVDMDMKKLFSYLTASDEKRKSRRIPSIRSRVANLTEFDPFITVEEVKDKLFEAFEDVYGSAADIVHVEEDKKFWVLIEKYVSSEWNRGR